MAPLFQATIIEHFEFIGYNERGNAICQTFFEQKQTANTTITFYRQVISSFSTANILLFADSGKFLPIFLAKTLFLFFIFCFHFFKLICHLLNQWYIVLVYFLGCRRVATREMKRVRVVL